MIRTFYLYWLFIPFVPAVISDAEVQLHFDEFFEEIFVEMEDKVTTKTLSTNTPQELACNIKNRS